ncbi:MAG: glutathione reductase [Myxococcales bacterium]|jgi:glutathione reductase (NADPH)|nr:glutathione reductase [Myxococcales bacterium]
METHDVVVIGTGSAASTVATRCRAAGWRVAIIDARPFGGTCALRGCDPKKVLVGAAELVDWGWRMAGKGVRSAEVRIDWPELMRFKRTFTDPVPESSERRFAKAGIETFHGRARFIDRNAISVGDRILVGRFVVIASGAVPADLGIPGQEHVTTSEQFLELEALPRRVLFIGGGYISFEFAHVSARAGADVVLVHRGARPLGGFDPDLVDRLVDYSRSMGMDVVLGSKVKAISRSDGALLVEIEPTSGGSPRTFQTDLVVHGAGRVPDIDDLNLGIAGVTREASGVSVNEYLQSISNPAVYAAGDAAASGLPLSSLATHEGEVVAANLLGGNAEKPDYRGVPTVVFSVPPLASVGLQEKAAREQGIALDVKQHDTSTWYTNRRVGEAVGAAKILVDEKNDRVVGAHLFGTAADEVINAFALAIRHDIKASALKRTILAYPTPTYDVRYLL